MADRHYSKTLEQRLRPFTDLPDPAGLVALLDAMSRSEQRTSGYILGERLLMECPQEAFWQLAAALVGYDSRAFLITLMKTFCERLRRRTAALSDAQFAALAATFNDIERQKVALLLLEHFSKPEDADLLLSVLGIPKGREQVLCLLRVDTPACLFLLLRNLRYIEHDKAELMQVARLLMKRNTGSSWSLASIMKVAFGLDQLTGTFSLRLQPYQIARLEQSYDAFCECVC